MLSSLGFDNKGTGRGNRAGPSRFFSDISRGLSVHVFKQAVVPIQVSQPVPPPPAPKYDAVPTRLPTSDGSRSRQLSYQANRNDLERKQAPVAISQDRRLVQVTQPVTQPWPVDTKYANSQKGAGYLIHHSGESDMYIYERSLLSIDDTLSSSPSSDSSEDSDLFPDAAMANLEISSTRASSSTETLESTLYTNLTTRNAIMGSNAAQSLSRPPLAITAPPRSTSTRPRTHSSNSVRPVVPLTRTESQRPRTASISHPVYPIQLNALDAVSDSDSETVVSETPIDNIVVDMLGPRSWPMSSGLPPSARSSTPARRDSVQRGVSTGLRREPSDSARDPPLSRTPPSPQYRDEGPRAPPGLQSAVATPLDGQRSGQAPSSTATPAVSSLPPAAAAPPAGSASRSSVSPPQLARTSSTRPLVFASEAPAKTGSEPTMRPPSTSQASATAFPSRNLRTPSVQCGPMQCEVAAGAATTKRCVKWSDNLICPSPVPFECRRKGWFNRRGDQLWTNDGYFKSPEPGQEYPPDLANYPEPNTGWMNEEGIRIDMEHRLIPKRPLRPALKQHRNTV
ncbi:hypothetical protein BD414DRAFT_581455 [Trametes punicea]|nr:hypothetical protein BD414DRAFT_581455 [Trametes punicea]